MKALFIVTGRGMGGDAMTALNISQSLESYKVECEYALDHSAPGILFSNKGITWHQISIPQAGGHAATKKTMIKAAFKTIKASLEASQLIRRINPDIVVGVIGGGAIIGSISAKLTGLPAVSILITPLDAQICTRLNTCIALPESNLFTRENLPDNIHKSYSPVDPLIVEGNKNKALENMPSNFRDDQPSILLSSGSTLFKKMAQAAHKLGETGIEANIIVVGHPLEDDYLKYLENVIYLGYIDWIKDLYQLVDLAVLTDDGMMIHEAMAFQLPVVALLGVKYGRYHNLAEVFKGAVLESELEDIETVIGEAFKNIKEMQLKSWKYGEKVLKSSDKIAKIIYEKIKENKRGI